MWVAGCGEAGMRVPAPLTVTVAVGGAVLAHTDVRSATSVVAHELRVVQLAQCVLHVVPVAVLHHTSACKEERGA